MRKVEVEVFSEAVNAWVLRTPGRQYPGVVIQGDTLHNLASLAEEMLGELRASRAADEVIDMAEELAERLSAFVAHYAGTLAAAGIDLPYQPR